METPYSVSSFTLKWTRPHRFPHHPAQRVQSTPANKTTLLSNLSSILKNGNRECPSWGCLILNNSTQSRRKGVVRLPHLSLPTTKPSQILKIMSYLRSNKPISPNRCFSTLIDLSSWVIFHTAAKYIEYMYLERLVLVLILHYGLCCQPGCQLCS